MSVLSEEWTLKRLLSDVIGSGPKSADDMHREQARIAFEHILDGAFDPTTLGAFLLANRWKGNTPEELAAFVDVMREQSVRSVAPSADPVDCGANYDGKRHSALLGVGAGIVAAAGGTPIAIHSGDRIPTHRGCAYKHVLTELGVPTDVAPDVSAAMIDEVGLGFYLQSRYNPGIHTLLPYRERMGVRTFLNTIETLANPGDASVHIGSFYHLTFAKRIIETIQESDSLAIDRVIMFQGLEGYDDLRPGYTQFAEWRDGKLHDYPIETERFDMHFDTDDLAVDDVPLASAQITESALNGDRTDQFTDAIVLNAAVRLYAGGRVDSIENGIEIARGTIADGSAARTLEHLRSFNEPA